METLQFYNPYKLNTSALRKVHLTLSKDAFEFENFDFEYWRQFMEQNWIWSVYLSILYVILIIVGTRWMSSRKPWNLKKVELIFNLALMLFNFTGSARVWPEVWRIAMEPDGVYRTFCVCEGHAVHSAFWGFLNVLSRVVELGGTAFIILRKKPLMFLHPYHHVVVLIFAFYYYQAYEVTLRIQGEVNAIVHTLFYLYFVLKGLGFKIRRRFSMGLTILQLGEMFFGIYLNLYGLQVKNSGRRCDREYPGIYAALSLYASFGLLFLKLFWDSYLTKKTKIKAKVA